MKCPACHTDDGRTIDSRPYNDAHTVKRRRECKVCLKRWTTVEVDLEKWQMLLDIAGMQLQIDAEKNGLAEKARSVLGVLFQE